MSTAPTQIRIDPNIKREARQLFASLGLDMFRAVHLFLRKCVPRGGLPFSVELPQSSRKAPDLLDEARQISADADEKESTITADWNAATEDSRMASLPRRQVGLPRGTESIFKGQPIYS